MAKIKITKNGPYLVSDHLPLNQDIVEYDQDGIPLKTKKGKIIPTGETYALCRCGQSQNKPFCDGSHHSTKFDGTENPEAKEKYDNQANQITGPDLILKDTASLCAGAGFCDRASGTWNLTENSDDPESKKTAIKEACCCPSGRLVACDRQNNKSIEPKLKPSIGISSGGPLCIKGGVPIESSDGSTYEIRNRVTLCRCGKSKNKPFCDGSHFD
ncbi:MAG: CDGSH iron-sulfur domain-containing protein [Candidatus Shapirobacteria bacterium]|jgi:CDGSH-type Zn-finger protein